MTCHSLLPSVSNTIQNIHISSTIFNKFTLTYSYNKNDGFGLFFGQYIYNYVNNIDHPALIKEWKSNMYKADYERKLKIKFRTE